MEASTGCKDPANVEQCDLSSNSVLTLRRTLCSHFGMRQDETYPTSTLLPNRFWQHVPLV